MSSGWRKSAEHVPKELQHRPPYLLKHMKETEKKAIAFKEEDIKKIKDGEYQVVSGPNSYTVTIW
jgi:predicted DNA-binding protein